MAAASFGSPGADQREGRLLETMLNVLVAGLSDPNRLSRGRTYARHGAVDDLDVEPGLLTGSVQGSSSQPYDVAIRVEPAESFGSISALVPGRREIRFSCSCPDSSEPCKHAIAVVIAFASLVADDPPMLGLWRGATRPRAGGRAVVGSRAGQTGVVHGAISQPGLDDEALASLHAFLGEPVDHQTSPVTRLGPPNAAWGELWAEMLADAIDHVVSDS